jgi:hypothetical protein
MDQRHSDILKLEAILEAYDEYEKLETRKSEAKRNISNRHKEGGG